jgi:sarcosine oxidase delta subunit
MAAHDRTKLDRALTNYNQIAWTLSVKIKGALKNLENFDGNPVECPQCHEIILKAFTIKELAEFARAVNQLMTALKTLTELAPFFTAKQNIEGTDHFLDWLLTSTEYIGEERERIIDIVRMYQLAIAQDASQIPKEQYQLL